MWKYVKWAIVSIVLVLVVSAGGWIGLVFYLFSGGCDEGPFSDWRSTNAQGDMVAEYARACTGMGTVVDYSIIFQHHGDNKPTTLVEHDHPPYGYPKFRWIDDESLNIDLGKVNWISLKTSKVGFIHITYVYSKPATSWW
jgi:hypothetical protein